MTVWETLATCDWIDRHECGHPRQVIDGHRLPCAECVKAPFWRVAVREPLSPSMFFSDAPASHPPAFKYLLFERKMFMGTMVPSAGILWVRAYDRFAEGGE